MKKIIGVNPAIETLSNKESNIEKVEVFKGLHRETLSKIRELASKRNVKIFYTDVRDNNSQGVTVYVSEYSYYVDFGAFLEQIATKQKSIVLILDEIQDPRNFGAIIRCAEIFGVDGIILPERNSVKITETVVKTSAGAIEYVPITKANNLSQAIDRLKSLDYWIYGADGAGDNIYTGEQYPDKVALVMGSEGNGIRKKVREHCDMLIKIPMYGKINSLNVSVASGILLSEIAKNHSSK